MGDFDMNLLSASPIHKYNDFENIFSKKYREYYQEISKISYDTTNKYILCDTNWHAYNFDKIIKSWSIKQQLNPFFTVDAVSFKSDFLNFIEFKNAKLSDEKKYQIYLKIDESYRWFEKVFLESHWLDAIDIKKRFIFVYNPEKIANGDKGYRDINGTIEALANNKIPKESKGEIVKSKLRRINKISIILKYFDDIQFLTADEFMKDIGKYCNR